jgi:hypothetical protein
MLSTNKKVNKLFVNIEIHTFATIILFTLTITIIEGRITVLILT